MVKLKKHYTEPDVKVLKMTSDSILGSSITTYDEFSNYDQLAKPGRFGAFDDDNQEKSSSSPWGK
jgi:hypothetical protein